MDIGHVLNDTYRIERLVGEGGMAAVYEASHTRLPDRRFALKLILPEHTGNEAFVRRFRQEALILSRLRHRNIVDIIDFNVSEAGCPYLVMDLLQGETLEAHMGRLGALPAPVVLRICQPIGEALRAAHGAGVTHRDLKPGNVFLCAEPGGGTVVKVLDFGIAKLQDPTGGLRTAAQSLLGTPAYMAPEQAQGRVEEIGPPTDQFALGTICWELLTGRPLFREPGDGDFTILERVVHNDPPPLPPELSTLDAVLRRALNKSAALRYESIAEFLFVLSEKVAALPPPATSPGVVLPPPPRRVALPLWQTAGGLLGLGLGVLLVAGRLRAGTPGGGAGPASKPAPPRAERAAAAGAILAGPAMSVAARDPAPAPAGPAPAPAVVPAQKTAALPPSHLARIAARTGPARTPVGVSPGAASKAPPARLLPPKIEVSGGDEGQRALIASCAQELAHLPGLPRTFTIRLVRVGALQIDEGAPDFVVRTELDSCLRRVFSKRKPPPEAVITGGPPR